MTWPYAKIPSLTTLLKWIHLFTDDSCHTVAVSLCLFLAQLLLAIQRPPLIWDVSEFEDTFHHRSRKGGSQTRYVTWSKHHVTCDSDTMRIVDSDPIGRSRLSFSIMNKMWAQHDQRHRNIPATLEIESSFHIVKKSRQVFIFMMLQTSLTKFSIVEKHKDALTPCSSDRSELPENFERCRTFHSAGPSLPR